MKKDISNTKTFMSWNQIVWFRKLKKNKKYKTVKIRINILTAIAPT